MYLHEYQAKELFSRFAIAVMPHHVVDSVDALAALDIDEAVLKIQVHAGGRGKAGGVAFVTSRQELLEKGKELLGMRIINEQTGPEGICARKLLVDTPVAFTHEYYLAVVLDRKAACATVIASKEGGVEIEEIAKHSPEKIITEKVSDCGKLHHFQYMRLISFLGLSDLCQQAISLISNCIDAFFSLNALQIEINPLVKTKDGLLVALDAKVQLDDNALFKNPSLQALADPSQLSIYEQQAALHDLSYVALNGTIGCMVNGAGLAMATMDLIDYWKGSPANFLDVGGGATEEKVTEGFKILFSNEKLRAILVNIFGGIMDCEIIARALLAAQKDSVCNVPIVVRMEGTNVTGAKKMLEESGIKIYVANSLNDAAKHVVEASCGHSSQ